MTVPTSTSVDQAFWDLVLADPELAATEFALLPEPDFPPPGRPPAEGGNPEPGPGRTCRPDPHPGRLLAGGSRTVPTTTSGTVRSPPASAKRRQRDAAGRRA